MSFPSLDQEKLERLAEGLPRLFYVLAALAFLTAVFGSPGTGLLLLILAGCAHVARVGIERLLDDADVSPARGR